LERHTYVAFLTAEQQAALVEGTGPEARFTDPVAVPQSEYWFRPSGHFEENLNLTLDKGRGILAGRYSDETNPDKQWWPDVRQRYEGLGRIMYLLVERPALYIRHESTELDAALGSATLAGVVGELTRYVGKQTPQLEPKEAVRAAHDLSYLPTSLAGVGIHDLRMRVSLEELNNTVTFDEQHQKYRLTRPADSNWDTVFFRHPQDFPNEVRTQKCPVHSKAEPDQAETTLTTYVHAAINLAADYGLFGT
jgi:hypothetical protein